MDFTFGLTFGQCFQGASLPAEPITIGGQTLTIGGQAVNM